MDNKSIKAKSTKAKKGQIRAQNDKKNVGKKFEKALENSFSKYPDVSIDRIPDQTTRFKHSTNICDYMVYKYPFQYFIECKSVHGNTLSIHSVPKMGKDGKLHGFYGNISDAQWEGLLKKAEIPGVIACVICWWVDMDITLYLPIQMLQAMRESGAKSVRYDCLAAHGWNTIPLKGEKKRVYFDYDVEQFFKDIHNGVSKLVINQLLIICLTKNKTP